MSRSVLADEFVWTDADGRRAHPLWRLLAAATLMTFLGFFAVLPIGITSNHLPHVGPVPMAVLLKEVTLAAVAVLVAVVLARTIDRDRPLERYGLDVDRSWFREAGSGLTLALAATGIPSIVGLGLGWYEVAAIVPDGVAGFALGAPVIAVYTLFVAVHEEVFYRGLVTTNAIELVGTGWRPAALPGGILLSAWWFASVHQAHPDVPVLLVTWVLAGVAFIVLYLASGRLALPIGAHAGYNLWHLVVFNDRSLDAGAAGVSPAVVEVERQGSVWLVGSGGAVQALGFTFVLVFGLLWVWFDRGSIRNRWRDSVSHLGSDR